MEYFREDIVKDKHGVVTSTEISKHEGKKKGAHVYKRGSDTSNNFSGTVRICNLKHLKL